MVANHTSATAHHSVSRYRSQSGNLAHGQQTTGGLLTGPIIDPEHWRKLAFASFSTAEVASAETHTQLEEIGRRLAPVSMLGMLHIRSNEAGGISSEVGRFTNHAMPVVL